MSTYVMSDIHGCYNEFHQMLDTIGFSPSDELILAGDYIDRGKQTLEMLYWLEDRPENVILLQGNHEAEYVAYIDIMKMVNDHEDLKLDVSSYKDSKELYDVVYYYTARKAFPFDVYGTVEDLIEEEGFTVEDLAEYADIFRNLPYYAEREAGGRKYIIVHAGYAEDLPAGGQYQTLEDYYLYARDEAYLTGGKPGVTVIAGHTPTVVEGMFTHTGGDVFYFYDEKTDRRSYNIDCGTVFRHRHENGKFACIRMEDERVFYV